MTNRYITWIPRPDMLKRISAWHVRLYRSTRGIVGSRLDGLDILLLTTRGRKTGKLRTAPLPYFRDGEHLVVVGSNGGSPRHPAWFHNLCAEPLVKTQVGSRRRDVNARVLEGAERERVWQQIVSQHPRYERYSRLTERTIPLVALQPLH